MSWDIPYAILRLNLNALFQYEFNQFDCKRGQSDVCEEPSIFKLKSELSKTTLRLTEVHTSCDFSGSFSFLPHKKKKSLEKKSFNSTLRYRKVGIRCCRRCLLEMKWRIFLWKKNYRLTQNYFFMSGYLTRRFFNQNSFLL